VKLGVAAEPEFHDVLAGLLCCLGNAFLQNLNVINGRPSWSSAFIMTAVNLSGLYTTPLRFKKEEIGEKRWNMNTG
jgi:hypothetical protein